MFTYNVHYIAAILLLTMLSFLFICTVLVSVNAIASRTVLRVISIEFLIHSSHKCYSPNIHCVRFHLKGRFMYLFVFCFAPLIVNGRLLSLFLNSYFIALNVLNSQVLVIFNISVRVVQRSFS